MCSGRVVTDQWDILAGFTTLHYWDDLGSTVILQSKSNIPLHVPCDSLFAMNNEEC